MRIASYMAAPLLALACLPLAGCGHEKSTTAVTNSIDNAFDILVNEDDLKNEEVELNRRCQDGSGDDPATQRSCDKRDHILAQLKYVGMCWGPSDQIEANKTWVKCDRNAAPSVQGATPLSPQSLADAEETVRDYYAERTDPIQTDRADSFFAPNLLRQYRAVVAATPKGDEGPIDFDIRSGGQDPDIKNLTFSTKATVSGARVTAHFDQWGQPTQIVYDLILQVDKGWLITDISEAAQGQSPAWDLIDLIKASG